MILGIHALHPSQRALNHCPPPYRGTNVQKRARLDQNAPVCGKSNVAHVEYAAHRDVGVILEQQRECFGSLFLPGAHFFQVSGGLHILRQLRPAGKRGMLPQLVEDFG